MAELTRKIGVALGDIVQDALPHSLLGRSVLIIVTPIVCIQIILAWFFYDSHWASVSSRLGQSVAGEIGMVLSLLPPSIDPVHAQQIFTIGEYKTGIHFQYSPGEILPNDPTVTRQNLVDRRLSAALADKVERPFILDSRSLKSEIEIHIQLPDGVIHASVSRRRLFTSTTYIFFLWMVGVSVALLVAATLFMRGQVHPIRRLAQAADDFGKGIDTGAFEPRGAHEVALAGHAFNQMRERIRRQIAQRTEMLAGVSHDLRTPLTRMRLELAMLGDGPAIESLKRDVGEMGRMIDEYLSFARGEGTGQGEECDMAMLIDEAVDDARRHGLNVSRGKIPTAARLSIRRDAVKRCLGNLLGNAQRYAQKARVSAGWTEDGFVIHVDDDGPGIAEEAREHVFRPFFRLDSSRNSETGGTGLGLTIARDIMHSHGGDIALDQSPLGGLRASLLFPS